MANRRTPTARLSSPSFRPSEARPDETAPGPHPALREEIADIRDLMGRLEDIADMAFGPPRSAVDPATAPPVDTRDQRAPVELSVWSPRESGRFLDTMMRLRGIEERRAKLAQTGHPPGAEPRFGREAVVTGIAQWLTEGDVVHAAECAHAYRLAFAAGAGQPLDSFAPNGFPEGTEPPVIDTGSTTALESAAAANPDGLPDIVVAVLGAADPDSIGIRDAFELAGRQNLPILFVGEAEPTESFLVPIGPATDSPLGRLAAGHVPETARVDGNDVIAVSETAGELIHQIRCGRGPAYLEAVTRSAVADRLLTAGADDGWRACDPIDRLRGAMLARGDVDAGGLKQLETEIDARIQAAADSAIAAL